jgi:hypothetical protein
MRSNRDLSVHKKQVSSHLVHTPFTQKSQTGTFL